MSVACINGSTSYVRERSAAEATTKMNMEIRCEKYDIIDSHRLSRSGIGYVGFIRVQGDCEAKFTTVPMFRFDCPDGELTGDMFELKRVIWDSDRGGFYINTRRYMRTDDGIKESNMGGVLFMTGGVEANIAIVRETFALNYKEA